MTIHLRTALIFFIFMTLLLGGAYPLLIWASGMVMFPDRATGSLIVHKHQVVGSALVGQNFEADRYFWGRLSATPSYPYNAQNSGSHHLNPDHPELLKSAKKRAEKLNTSDIPIDLVTTSASGLDPHISPQAARIQIPRIVNKRNIQSVVIQALIEKHTTQPTFGFLGMPRVNVLQLNLSLDKI